MAFAQERLALSGPEGLWDVMEDSVGLKRNVFFGVFIRMIGDHLVLNHRLRLLAAFGLRHFCFRGRTVLSDLYQGVVVVHRYLGAGGRWSGPVFPRLVVKDLRQV